LPDPTQGIGPGPKQVSFGILQVVLVEFQLRLQQVKLLLELIILGFRCDRFFFQAIDEVFVCLDLSLGSASTPE
jgi:hypothetical protein